MTHNETRISNERLAEMLAGLEGVTPGPWNRRRVGHQWAVEDRHTRHIAMMQNSVDERQGNAAHIARCDPETIHAMILELQALRSTPVEAEPVAWLKVWTTNIGAFSAPGRRVDFSPNLEPWLEPLTPTVTPLYARPLPNPSPSDGEVITWECKDYADGWIPFNTLAGALEYQSNSGCVMRPVRALQSSKRGQP